MSRSCELTGKGVQSGNNVSHANNKTKRKFLPNLQNLRVEDKNGTVRRARVCTKCIKSGMVKKPLKRDIPVTAGERGRLIGAVTSNHFGEDICREGIEIDRHALHLREPIKALGDYKIDVRVMPGVEATVSLSVVAAES